MKIISGKTGSPHVTSQQFRQILEGIIGDESYILPCGENLTPELQTNNSLKIRSGLMYHHGNVSTVELGTYDEVTIQNGTQGMKRIDLVVNRYTREEESGTEKNEWVVIQGTPQASDPAVPDYTEGNLQDGDLVDDCPYLEVHLDGINVTEVIQLLEVADNVTTLRESLKPTDWTAIGTSNRMTARYRNNGHACEVEMDGSLGNAGLQAWESFQIGTLPEGMRPSMTMMVPSCIPGKYMMQIETDGKVLFVATSTFSGSNDHVRAQCMYFI